MLGGADMTAEGGAVGFLVRLLLGGALISGALLYASQALQKAPAPDKGSVSEKIGPTLSQPKPLASAAPSSAKPQAAPLPPAPQAAPAVPPAAVPAPVPEQSAVQALVPADPTPRALVRAPSPAPTPVEPQLSTASATDDPGIDAPADPKPRGAARQRGSAGCTSYKSYNAATQTYRSFDGKIRECHP
jgi:hypothetical protein